jgi:hypothetical protein
LIQVLLLEAISISEDGVVVNNVSLNNVVMPRHPAANTGVRVTDPDRKTQPIADEKLDKVTDGLGAQGFIQDTTRALWLFASRTAGEHRLVGTMMGFFAGERDAVDKAVRGAASKAHAVAHKVKLPHPHGVKAAAVVNKAVVPATEGVLRALGKLGPLISIPFAGYDVLKAWTAKPEEKNAAWANATFTVAGTAMGVAGVALGGTFGIPLLVGSAVIGLGQLADAYLNGGKAQARIGDMFVGPVRRLLASAWS